MNNTKDFPHSADSGQSQNLSAIVTATSTPNNTYISTAVGQNFKSTPLGSNTPTNWYNRSGCAPSQSILCNYADSFGSMHNAVYKISYPGTVQGEAMSSIPSVTSVTVEGWICSPEATNELAMIGWSSGVTYVGYMGLLNGYVCYNGNSYLSCISTSSYVPPNTWVLLRTVWNCGGNSYLYCNNSLIATFTGCSQWGGPNNLFVNISPYPSGSVSAWASFDAISVSTDPGYTPGISGNRSTFLSTTYVLNATNLYNGPFNITSFNAFFTETMNQTGNSINMNFTNFVLHSQINEGTFINNMSLYLNNYGTNFFNQSQYLLPILFFGAYNDTRYGLLQFNCSIQFQLYFFLTSPPPPTLSSITPNPSTTGNITLQWTSSTGAISYNIYRYPSPILVINGSVSQVCTTANLSYNDSLLTNGLYYYAISASNASGISAPSNCLSVLIVLPPLPPVMNIISPNPSYTGSIAITWTAVSGATCYYVYRDTNPITTVGLLNFVANTTTTSDIDTIGSIGTYYYAIVASSLFGNSSVSNNVSVTVSPPIPPLMSTISPNPNYNGSIAITWTAVSGATCYYVYRDTNPITTVGLLNFVANTTTTSDIDTIGSIGTYYYAIVASSLFGNSSVSNNVSVTVSPPIPPLMSTISPNPNYNGSIAITWTAVSGATCYYVYRDTNPITTVGLLNFVANTTTTSDIDTIGSIGTYYYAIVASSLFGNSSVSNNVSVTVSPPIPPLMSTISPNPNYNGSIAITWTAVSGATCYYVYRDTNPITTVGLLNFVANTTTTSDIDTIGSIGTYYYAIVASSLFGNSSVSNNVSVTVSPPIPPLMSTISPNPNYNGSIAITWTAVSGATCYYVYRDTNPITTVGLLNFVANTTTTSDIDTIGSIGTYYYAIVASSLFGNSSVSNNVSVTVSPPIPPLMSTISPNPNYNGSIAITWTAVSGATCYYVYRDTNPITTVGLLNFVANTTTTSDIDTIGSIGTYYYTIVASSLFGNSSVSNNVSVTVSPPIPPLMSTISPNPNYNGSIAITWTAVSGATCYYVYRDTNPITTVGLLNFVANTTTTSDIDTIGSIGTYYYAIVASSLFGNSSVSNNVSVRVSTPGSPVNLQVTRGIYSLGLNWSAPINNPGSTITYYNIYWGVSNSSLSFLISEPLLQSWYNKTDLGINETYYFAISANNTLGEGTLCAILSNTTIVFPRAPTNLSTMAFANQIEISWNAPVDNGGAPINNYTIYRGNSSGIEIFLITLGNITIYNDTGLINGQTYFYFIAAINAQGIGANSTEVYAIPKTIPTAPQSVGTSFGNAQILLTWKSPVDNGGDAIKNYTIYRGNCLGNETLLIMLGNVTTFIDSGLTNGQVYYYKICCNNSAGTSPFSAETFAIPRTIPTAPQNILIDANDNQEKLSWVAPVSNGGSTINNYTIFRNGTLLVVLGSTFSYVDKMITKGFTYTYQITANNSVGESVPSAIVSAPTFISTGLTTGGLYGINPPSFIIMVEDSNLNMIWYSLDGGITNTTCGLTGNLADQWGGQGNGTVQVTFWANNTEGNLKCTQIWLQKDIIAPPITATGLSSQQVYEFAAPSFTLSINDPNLATIWYSLDGGKTNTTCGLSGTLAVQWVSLGSGNIIVTFWANDTVGNVGKFTITIHKDITTPIVDAIAWIVAIAGIAISVNVAIRVRRKYYDKNLLLLESIPKERIKAHIKSLEAEIEYYLTKRALTKAVPFMEYAEQLAISNLSLMSDRIEFFKKFQTFIDVFVQEERTQLIIPLIEQLKILFEKIPPIAEDNIKIAPLLQKDINCCATLQEFQLAIELLTIKLNMYAVIQNQFVMMGMETLLVSIKEEVQDNNNQMQKLEQCLWTQNFNAIADKIAKAQKAHDFPTLFENISNITGMLEDQRNQAVDTNNITEQMRCEELLTKYLILEQVNRVWKQYIEFDTELKTLASSSSLKQVVFGSKLHVKVMDQLNNLERKIHEYLQADEFTAVLALPVEEVKDADLRSMYYNLLIQLQELRNQKQETDLNFTYQSIEAKYNDLIQQLKSSKFDNIPKEKQSLIDRVNKLIEKLERIKQPKAQLGGKKIPILKGTVSDDGKRGGVVGLPSFVKDNTLTENLKIEKVINEEPEDVLYELKAQIYANLQEMLSKMASFEEIITTQQIIQEYRILEEKLNTIGQGLTDAKLTQSSNEIQELQTQTMEFQEKVNASIASTQAGQLILNATEQLLKKIQAFLHQIEVHFNLLMQGQHSEEIKFTSIKVPLINTDIQINTPQISETVRIKQKKSHYQNETGHFFGQLMDVPTIPLVAIKSPLHAKVVLLGESSVGKTHLALSMTNAEYSPTQGSTVGVDKFFKAVRIPMTDFDTRICFWDLGGQWNYRTINVLFIHDAAIILLVYDVTRQATFESLTYWLEMIKTTQCCDNSRVFLIGNKTDVGGNTIMQAEVDALATKYHITHIYLTSAKTKEGIAVLLEDMVGAIDWIGLIHNMDATQLQQVGHQLKRLQDNEKIWRTEDLTNKLHQILPQIDLLTLHAILDYYATQELVLFSHSKTYLILDPEFSSKFVAKLVRLASQANGFVHKGQFIKDWHLGVKQLAVFFDYLEEENKCFAQGKDGWMFPNVITERDLALEDWIKNILDSATQTLAYRFEGPGELFFADLVMILSREIAKPIKVSNSAAVWNKGQGLANSVVLIQYIASKEGGMIRIKAGGAEGSSFISQVQSVVEQIFTIHGSEFTQFD